MPGCVTQKADLTKPQGWRLLKMKNKIPLIMMKNSLLYVKYLEFNWGVFLFQKRKSIIYFIS